MPVTISGTTGVQGNVTGNVTGAVTGNASTATLATTIADSSVLRPKLGYNGAILQVVQGFIGYTWSTTSTTAVDVPGLSAVITPSSVNSKILVSAQTCISRDSGTNDAVVNLIRGDGTLIGNSTSGGSFTGIFGQAAGQNTIYQAQPCFTTFLDSPNTTSPVSYKVQLRNVAAGTAFIGRRAFATDFTSPSNVTLMEVASGYAS